MFLKRFASALISSLALPGPAYADALPGPYVAAVERVVDGDTLAVRVKVWLELELTVLVRIRGVDAPELRGRCDSEKSRAIRAAEVLRRLVAEGGIVLTDVEGDKYFGRVVADLATLRGQDVAEALLAAGVVRVYDGASRAAWCEVGTQGERPPG